MQVFVTRPSVCKQCAWFDAVVVWCKGFFLGVALVLAGMSWIGFIVELMGFLSLFGNYFPYVWSVIKTFGTGSALLAFALLAHNHTV